MCPRRTSRHIWLQRWTSNDAASSLLRRRWCAAPRIALSCAPASPANLHELRGGEQVPEGMRKRVPGDFEVVAQRKGFLRFRNPELTELVAAHAEASQKKEACLASALQVRQSHSSA